VVNDVGDFLVAQLDAARAAGIDHESLCADPGIGFGKTVHHNLELVARLRELVDRVGVPLLFGASRKTFIGWVTDVSQPAARDDGTLATTVWAIDHGASVVRVHAVRQAVEAVQLLTAMEHLDVEAVA
jgi:dihydropteroate synthase